MRCQHGLTKLCVFLGACLLVGVGLSQAQSATAAPGSVIFTVTAAGKTETDLSI